MHGTEFVIRIPAAPPEVQENSRILLIEDEPGLVMTVYDLLTAEGYDVQSAGDGEEGFRQASAGDSTSLCSM